MKRDTIKTIAALAFLLAAFAFAGGCDRADAAVTAPQGGWGNAYQQAALEYWGGAQPIACTTYAMEFDSPVPKEHGEYVGWASVPAHLGSQCYLYVGPMQGMGLYLRCVVYAHEYGHTLGMGHVDDPSMVMYGGVLGQQTIDQPCRELVQRAHSGWEGY